MKKIFTLLAAAAITLSAAAINHNLGSLKKDIKLAPEAPALNQASIRTFTEKVGKVAKSVAGDEFSSYTWNLIGEGKYAASILAEMYGGSNDPVDVDVYEADEAPGLYKLVGVWPDLIRNGGELVVDATDPDFVYIPRQDTGLYDNVDGETYIASLAGVLLSMGYPKSLIKSAAPEAVYSIVDNVITIPEETLLLDWPNAPANSIYGTEPDTWEYANSIEGAVVLPGGEYVDPWAFIGVGSFKENIISSWFSDEESTEEVDVDVYESTSTPGVYKVVEGLKYTYQVTGLSQYTAPDLKLNATDPTNVSFANTSTGINAGAQYGVIYISSIAGNYNIAGHAQISLEKVDNDVTITFPEKSCVFTGTGSALSGNAYYAAFYESTLKFSYPSGSSAIESIAAGVESNNAPVEYFNLQGIRVSNPSAGQVVIRRQGSEVSKTIVR